MANIEDRVVSMRFDNSRFLNGVRTTISALDQLRQKMSFRDASKGLDEVQNSANRFNLNPVGAATQRVSAGFAAMATVAITAISNIVNRAVDAGLAITRALTIDPPMDGLREYETNLNSIQTILANTQAAGTNLQQVTGALEELNHYSDKTIYNFSEMARNIGTFTAAGVDLETSVSAIKGIANLAAMSGSNSQQAATAMYQLSQALAAGKVTLMDWNSVVNAGMGGAVFQKALTDTAVAMGTLKAEAVTMEGPMKQLRIDGESFRNSLSVENGDSWLTSEVLTNTLKQFTGDMTEAELAAMGFTSAQIKDIQAMADTAMKAATEVKTLTAVFHTAKEVAGSGWAKTWQIIFGDFEEAKTTFTAMSNAINHVIEGMAEHRNKLFEDWSQLGGRTAAIEAVKNIFEALSRVVTTVKQAFHDIFPPMTAQQLYNLTVGIKDFTENLKLNESTLEKVRRAFAGLFAIFSIIGQVIQAVVGAFALLIPALAKNSGGFLDLLANVGDNVVAFDNWLKTSGLIQKAAELLAAAIRTVAHFFGNLAHIVGGFVVDIGMFLQLDEVFARLQMRMEGFRGMESTFAPIWEVIGPRVRQFIDIMRPLADSIVQAFGDIFSTIKDVMTANGFSGVLDTINVGLLGGILLLFRRFVNEGISLGIGGDLVEGLTGTFDALTDTLGAMQSQLQAKTLMNIAIAIGVLTAALLVLASIDSGKLTKALTAMSVAFTQLLASMAVLIKIGGAAGFVQIPMIATAMISLAVAVGVLTIAVKKLSELSWGDMLRGLTGTLALLGAIVGVAYGLTFAGGPIMRTALALIPFAVGVRLLASSVSRLGSMSWGDLGKGLLGMAAALAAVVGAMWLMPPHMLANAAGLFIVSIALTAIGQAIQSIGSIKGGNIAKGLLGIGAALVVIAGALWLMPPHMIAMAAGLVVVGHALVIIAGVMRMIGGMSGREGAKAIVGLGSSLLILAGSLYLMTGTIAGAVALTVAAVALGMLVPPLLMLSAISWSGIAKGLVALAGTFAVVGVAGLLLTPLIPVLLGLGAALLLIGAGFALAGAGAFLVAAALDLFTRAGQRAVQTGGALIEMIPRMMVALAEGVIGFATALATNAADFATAAAQLIGALLQAITTIAPQLEQAVTSLIRMLLDILQNNLPVISNKGAEIMTSMLEAMERHIPRIVPLASRVTVMFLDEMSKATPPVINAGVRFVVAFMNGVADAIERNSKPVADAGGRIGRAIVQGMVQGLGRGASEVSRMATQVANNAIKAAKEALGIKSPSRIFRDEVGAQIGAGMAEGIDSSSVVVERSSEHLGDAAVAATSRRLGAIGDILNDSIDRAPVITPVLDDKKFKGQLADGFRTSVAYSPSLPGGGLTSTTGMEWGEVVRQHMSATRPATIQQERKPVAEIKFEQTINSPEPVNAAEVYRNTRTQLAMMKASLGV